MKPKYNEAFREQAVLKARKDTYNAAKEANPARWSKEIRNWEWQAEVFLNPDKPSTQPANCSTNSVH